MRACSYHAAHVLSPSSATSLSPRLPPPLCCCLPPIAQVLAEAKKSKYTTVRVLAAAKNIIEAYYQERGLTFGTISHFDGMETGQVRLPFRPPRPLCAPRALRLPHAPTPARSCLPLLPSLPASRFRSPPFAAVSSSSSRFDPYFVHRLP